MTTDDCGGFGVFVPAIALIVGLIIVLYATGNGHIVRNAYTLIVSALRMLVA